MINTELRFTEEGAYTSKDAANENTGTFSPIRIYSIYTLQAITVTH